MRRGREKEEEAKEENEEEEEEGQTTHAGLRIWIRFIWSDPVITAGEIGFGLSIQIKNSQNKILAKAIISQLYFFNNFV